MFTTCAKRHQLCASKTSDRALLVSSSTLHAGLEALALYILPVIYQYELTHCVMMAVDIRYPTPDSPCPRGSLFQNNQGNGFAALPSGQSYPSCGAFVCILIGSVHGGAVEKGAVFIAPDQSLVVVDSQTATGGWDIYKSVYGNIAQPDGTDHISFYDCLLTEPSSCPDGQ